MRNPTGVLLLLLLLPSIAVGQTERQPSQAWLQYATPADAGFDAERLAAAKAVADSAGSAAVMAVHRGHVVAAWGDVEREFQAHSVRKSLVSALYGIALARGEVDLEATLAELEIDDVPPLTDAEQRARVRDLLTARSGVYHGAAYAPSDQDEQRPARGAHGPDEHWYYNNWDFNVAGVIHERATGEDLYVSFARRIAMPTGMQDYEPEDGFLAWEPTLSQHPAHTFRVSTRDLARFGQLYLNEGEWGGTRVVPAEWVRRSTAPVSELPRRGRGYAYMWWTYAAGSLGDDHPVLDGFDSYAASGTGGQGVLVVPGAELVIVHRGDTDNGDGAGGAAAWAVFEAIASARTGEAKAEPRLIPMRADPLAGQVAAPVPLDIVPMDEAPRADYLGVYRMQPGDRTARVYVFRDRLFGWVEGLGDAELFPLGGDEFAVRVVPDTRVRFSRDDAGRVVRMELDYRGRVMPGERVTPRAPVPQHAEPDTASAGR